MYIKYNIELLKKTLDDFCKATGINICLVDADNNIVNCNPDGATLFCNTVQSTCIGKNNCKMSDMELLKKCKKSKKKEFHVCHAGLIDVCVPIIREEHIIGYILLGQIKHNEDHGSIEKYLVDFDDETVKKLKESYNRLPLFDDEKIESISNIALMLAKYIIFQNMMEIKYNKNFDNALKYINENIESKLTLEEIVKETNISKSLLYNLFKKYYDCSVGEYIKKLKIEKSIEYLLNSDMLIEEIAQKLGFSDSAYYSKVFKGIKGVSPKKYKKENVNKSID